MNKQEVVRIMTETVNNINRQLGSQQGSPIHEVEQAIAQHQPQLNQMNEMIYDALVINGVIKF